MIYVPPNPKEPDNYNWGQGSSAQSIVSNHLNDESPMSFEDFYKEYTGYSVSPYGLFGKLDNFFTGRANSAQQAYENYLAEYENHKNANQTALANQQTYQREDSQIQRLIEDYQAAGLNPYALLSGGNLSAGVVSSQAQRPEYKRARKRESSKKEKSMIGTALKLLAILALKG